MRLHTRWTGLVCAACLVLLIVIRYCCIEVLLEVIVLPASYHQKDLASKKKKKRLVCDQAEHTKYSHKWVQAKQSVDSLNTNRWRL